MYVHKQYLKSGKDRTIIGRYHSDGSEEPTFADPVPSPLEPIQVRLEIRFPETAAGVQAAKQALQAALDQLDNDIARSKITLL